MSADSHHPTRRSFFGLSRTTMIVSIVLFSFLLSLGGGWYWYDLSTYVTTDNAQVSAPLITLASQTSGILKSVMVKQGDWLPAHTIVARVGDDMIHTEVSGIAVAVQRDIGALYTAGQPVVTMIQPRELRIVARVAEDSGLKDIYAGQHTFFTVDAFGSSTYEGIVESVSDTNHAGDIVFSISDKRQTKEFDVQIRYDVSAYPELQNGMSARVWIVK